MSKLFGEWYSKAHDKWCECISEWLGDLSGKPETWTENQKLLYQTTSHKFQEALREAISVYAVEQEKHLRKLLSDREDSSNG